jgi:hypothetical protein
MKPRQRTPYGGLCQIQQAKGLGDKKRSLSCIFSGVPSSYFREEGFFVK